MDGGLRPLRAKLKDCGIIEETGDSNEAVFQETIVHGGGYGCDWLEFELGPDFLVCWLKGHDRGELVYATFL